MRPCSRLLLCALFVALAAPPALSQKRFCPTPPPSPFKHDGQIVTKFDGRAGGMRTILQHPRPIGSGAEVFYLAASFMHQDPRRPAAPALDLLLVSGSPLAHLRAGQQVTFVLDGQARAVNQSVSYASRPDGSGGTLDSASIKLSYADASAITHARRVVARVGGAEVELTNNHLEALREMISLLAPSSGRWQTAGRE
ncbi:MAG TPA: hypothetical protein VKB12_13580 [Pyrinomonadaceae bacterium]|nr:hypothetical protein [Pyrinomonadaceae bacterium]